MTKNYSTQRVTVPTVYVTKGRQRVKQYENNKIYLRNGDEFELELFNPTTSKVLAKISLNGIYLGSSIILRPGERMHLERFLNESKKFLFETYEVDSNDYNAVQAIKNNGLVEVEFYEEYKPQNYSPNLTYAATPNYWYTSPNIYGGNTTVIGNSANQTFTYSGNTGVSYVDNTPANEPQAVYSCCTNPEPQTMKETGRIEQGSNSNQIFVPDSTSFNSYYSWKTTWTILPESQRHFVKEDIKVFCTDCGAKRKKSTHKFCPNCGMQF